MKKRLPLIFCIAAVLLLAASQLRDRVIGAVKGPEMDQIVIDGVVYEQNNDTGLSYADQGRFLGRAVSGDITFRVYSVKGDTEGRYLYRLWEWEGAFYEKKG